MADAPQPGPVPAAITADMIGYDIDADTSLLRHAPAEFESLRNHYPLRREPGQ